MSDSTPKDANGGAPNAPQSGPQGAPPSISVKAQYLKDLSFENPRAPASFQDTGVQPQFEVNVDVNARGLGENNYEIDLSVTARARRGDETVFVVETTYAGVFEINNVPQEQLEPVMLVECPSLLFPFMRQIVADATRNGNFPPLMLEPINFVAIYQHNKMQQAEAGAEPAPASA